MSLCKGNILRSCKEETLILVENLDMQNGKRIEEKNSCGYIQIDIDR